MNRFTLLPSVNWNTSHMLVVNETGTLLAYGSRGDVVIVNNVDRDDLNELNSRFISRAHKNQRVMGLIFVKCELAGQVIESLVSCGDDGQIKVWDLITLHTTHRFIMKKANPTVKFVDLDYYSKSNCIVCAAEQKTIVKWDLLKNKVHIFNVDAKVSMTCIAACPHENDLVAVGGRNGLVLIYTLQANAKLRHKIRCHDSDVYSVTWCPVPYNAFLLEKLKGDSFNEKEFKETDRTLLLGSCSKDRSIYICKAGTNGYCEAVVTLPSKAILSNSSTPRFATSYANFERGRCMKWINPLVMITFTDFNEMVFTRLNPTNEQKLSSRQLLSNIKMEVKPLHNIHQRSISNFAVHTTNTEDLIFRVWSCSADRLLVRCGYKHHFKEKPLVLPLLSGFIFSLDISPTTFDRLAIGTGDGKICLWDLGSVNTIEVSTLSRKIDGKVMSLKWHPHEEGILAFGTYEGRVGIFDVSMGSKTKSWLFKIYHHKPIYKLCWAPPLIVNSDITEDRCRGNLYLFAVGNGDIVQIDPNDVNKMPISLSCEIFSSIEEKCRCKFKTDMCIERDRKVFAVGLSNGDVCIFSINSCDVLYVIKEQLKSIMALAWHHRIVLDAPSESSPFSNWLAVAGENVCVYEIDEDGKSSLKKVASLEIHSSRVLDIAWSPYINGRLLSCSADATVIIWDVPSQTIVGRYVEHCAQVLCGVWSLTNKDVAITGSSDFTCRMWSVSRDTITTKKEVKKINDKPIEPAVVNVQIGNVEIGAANGVNNLKIKNETFLPSIANQIHTCSMLENVVEAVFGNRTENGSFMSTSKLFTLANEQLPHGDTSEPDNCSCLSRSHSVNQDADDSKKKNQERSVNSEYNYWQLFGPKDQLFNLVRHEERLLENNCSNNSFVLVQARHGLKAKITEAIEKNEVTEHMLTLATAVSPKLWRDACQVYIDQLIQSHHIMQATNFLLAMNKEEEAINILCDNNKYKEAFALARLRFDDNVMCCDILEKWIHFCFNSGLYRLAAHCYLFLDEVEKAGIMLGKSKNFKDMILAAKLMKHYQVERACELVVDSFKRHLPSFTAEEISNLLASFPEIKFLEAWYLSYKYLMKTTPNTADVTKWLIGILDDEDNLVWKSMELVDFEKLQKVIVDNTFDMKFDELAVYVSAQIALYLSGLSNSDFEYPAIRHYIRGLFYCNNYLIVNSTRTQCDSAYPMMKLLRLIFPKGIINIANKNNDVHSQFTTLRKSINAYFCDFVISWLISCEELPRSLKKFEAIANSKSASEFSQIVRNIGGFDELDANESSFFAIINDKKRKICKMYEILEQFVEDVLDLSAVLYLQNVTKVKQFDDSPVAKVTDSKCQESQGHSRHDWGKSFEVYSCEELSVGNINKLRKEIEKFEKERVAVPNPFVFYFKIKDYLRTNKHVDPVLVTKMEHLLVQTAAKCGIVKTDQV